jgi:DNA adenine methylase
LGKYKTPLRYPGGKQKIAPFIIEVLEENNLVGGHYVEPYAGGAGVAIELLLDEQVTDIHLNDSCPAIFSFWHSILNETEEFCYRISRTPLNVTEWRKQKTVLRNTKKFSHIDIGFAMFYLNRCNRSGILSGGVIGGLNQTGKWKIDARFPRNELIRRIEAIAEKKRHIHLRNWDAEKILTNYITKLPRKTLIYCDPPYFKNSEKLYLNHYTPKDHEHISKVIQEKMKHPWVVSYDNQPEILTYYKERRNFTYAIQYNAAQAYMGRELFIFSDDLDLPESSSLPNINQSLGEIVA